MEAEDDHVAWVELDTEFHATIASASKNSVFTKIVGDIRESLARQSETVNVVSGRREPSDKEHRIIVETIAAQDKDAAEEAMASGTLCQQLKSQALQPRQSRQIPQLNLQSLLAMATTTRG